MTLLKYLWVLALLALAVMTALWPHFDLQVTRHFYVPGKNFPWRYAASSNFIHEIASGAFPKILALMLAGGAAIALLMKRSPKPWFYLLLVLVLGPGLLANTLLKDQWGRARPLQVEQFGGKAHFSAYWQPTHACFANCSFINGDGAFGFALAAPALVMQRRRRLWFWAGTMAGIVFGGVRIAMGAHFLSDTVFSALLMLLTIFFVYAICYGRRAAAQAWQTL